MIMRELKEKAGKYSIGAIILFIIFTLIELNIFPLKSDVYRDFVTKTDYSSDQANIATKLDYIIKRIDFQFDKK